MNLSYNQLKMIIKIAEMKSITSAAIDMNISQPALSKKLNDAERRLGTTLFDRNGRGVELTGLGKVFCDHANNIISQYDNIQKSINELSGQLVGSVQVVFPDGVGKVLFIPLLNRMAQKYPLVKLSLQAALPDMVPYHLNSGKADLGITANTSPNIVYQGMPLFKETLHLIGPRESFLQEKSSITLQEVSELPLLLPMIEGSRRLFDQSFEKIGVKPKVVYEIDSPSTMLDLVNDNKGFAILSYAMVHRMVDLNEITNSIIVDPSIDRILYTSYPINRPQTLLCRVVEREIIDLVSINSKKAQWELISNKPSNPL